jgi:quercetin 2,3-dioxygenase
MTSKTSNASTMAPIIKVIPNDKLNVSKSNPRWFGNATNPTSGSKERESWSNKNWLKSRFHFSFAEYHNSHNSKLGVVKVMNNDLVQPHRGFASSRTL